jgi:hypothetical protein
MRPYELAQAIEAKIESATGIPGCFRILRPDLQKPINDTTNAPFYQIVDPAKNGSVDTDKAGRIGFVRCRFHALALVHDGDCWDHLNNGIDWMYLYADLSTCELMLSGCNVIKDYLANQNLTAIADRTKAALDNAESKAVAFKVAAVEEVARAEIEKQIDKKELDAKAAAAGVSAGG